MANPKPSPRILNRAFDRALSPVYLVSPDFVITFQLAFGRSSKQNQRTLPATFPLRATRPPVDCPSVFHCFSHRPRKHNKLEISLDLSPERPRGKTTGSPRYLRPTHLQVTTGNKTGITRFLIRDTSLSTSRHPRTIRPHPLARRHGWIQFVLKTMPQTRDHRHPM